MGGSEERDNIANLKKLRGRNLKMKSKSFLTLVITAIFTTLTILAFMPNVNAAGSLTNVSVTVTDPEAGVTTAHWIYFTTANSIPSDGKIIITYPSGFDVSDIAVGDSSIDGSFSKSVSGQVITLTRSGGTATTPGAEWIKLTGVTNTQTAGSYTVTVETQNSGGTTIDGPTDSSSFTINAGDAVEFSLSATATMTAGESNTMTITAKDQYGNTATSYTGTIHFTTTDPASGALVPDDYQFQPSDNGVKVFDGSTAGQIVKFITIGEHTVTATDTDDSSITGSQTGITVVSGAETSYTIILNKGWNLISFPLIPTDTNIETVLATLNAAGKVNKVWAYDAGNTTWLTWGPSPAADTLTTMTAGYGYWINMSEWGVLTITGKFCDEAGSMKEYPLYRGWNLIGVHSTTNKTASDYLNTLHTGNTYYYSTTLWGYQSGSWVQVNNTGTLYRGYGYWIYCYEDVEIYQ